MPAVLNNDFFHFELHHDRLIWGLQPPDGDGMSFKPVRMKVRYTQAGKTQETLFERLKFQAQPTRTLPSPLGELELLEVRAQAEGSTLHFRVFYALAKSTPLFLWKLELENSSRQPVFIQRITLLELEGADAPFGALAEAGFFSNGWGSWNHSGAYGTQDYYRRSHLGFFDMPMRLNAGSLAPRQIAHFAADMFGVLGDRAARKAALLGFLSQQQHFGSLEVDFRPATKKLRLWANGDETRLDEGVPMQTDWACLQWVDLDSPEPLAPYLDAAARFAGITQERFQAEVPSGWCSWYHFYNRVSAQDIRSNLEKAVSLRAELPLQVIQIDDGFETRVGDWLDFKPGFPQGVAPLAREIRAAGFTPGLWLAPFILDRRSRLARQHPDWLLRGRFGLPVNAGYLWNGFATALDLSQPQALEHVCSLVKTAVQDWGFPYLKFDFLYAGALPGRRADQTKTRAQILRAGIQALRSAAGENTFLLGCGCPLGSALGLVDGMRIGADVDSRWTPVMLGKDIPFLREESDQPCARNAIHNTLTRAFMHRRWWYNDPDCLLLRPTANLSMVETQSLATAIALSGGMFLLSDDLPTLPPPRLEFAQALLPAIGKRPQVLDWFDAGTPRRLRLDLSNGYDPWSLLGLFNWSGEAQEMQFCLDDFAINDARDFWLREFWRGEPHLLSRNAKFSQVIPAHGVCLFAARGAVPGAPVYLGSDLHISQGQEVERLQWQPAQGVLELLLSRPGAAAGNVDLFLPCPPLAASLGGEPLTWSGLGQGVFRFPLTFERQAVLRIQCTENLAD